MARNPHNDENSPRPPRRSKPTTTSNRRHSQAPLRDMQNESEDPRVRELEAQLAARDAEIAQLRADPPQQPGEAASSHGPRIKRPKKASKVPVTRIREMLDMPKARWNALRTAIRFALGAARIDMHDVWKAQENDRLAAAGNVVKDDFPELRRFNGNWAFQRLAQAYFSGSKSYRNCVDNPSTYRGRLASARRNGQASSRRRIQHRSSRSPTPGPSHASTRRSTSASPPPLASSSRHRRTLVDDDDDNQEEEDDLLNFSSSEEVGGTRRTRDDIESEEEEQQPAKRRRTD
ncbi:hypothetical protein MKEN_01309200 [Mycena kentingensis (nom. inval.)]|nr:hypothetical protein MKEN_01309200 [Mycena kentingensis (nom. inval.)]